MTPRAVPPMAALLAVAALHLWLPASPGGAAALFTTGAGLVAWLAWEVTR